MTAQHALTSNGPLVELDGDGEVAAADGRQGIQSVEIAMQVLMVLEGGGGPMSLSAISQALGSRPSKVHRYLVSFGRVGLTSQDSRSGLYDFGPAMRRLGAEALRRTNEVSVASACAVALRDQTGHSVNVAVWGDGGPVVVNWAYGSHPLSLTVSALPCHCWHPRSDMFFLLSCQKL